MLPPPDRPRPRPHPTPPAVRAAGGTPLPTGVSLAGWTVTTAKAPIDGEAAAAALRGALGGDVPALPEQCHSAAHVTATHAPSGVTLRWDARGALAAWLARSRDGGAPPPPRVPAAAAWRAAREREIAEHAAPTLAYDWTFTAPYKGDVEGGGKGGQPACFRRSASARLDRAALTARDPILAWDAVPLFASELDDCGLAVASVRVRVMPGCWFVLARTFVRVDGVLVRLYESRVQASFDVASPDAPPRVVREWRAVEGNLSDLAAAGAPGGGPAYADADTAAAALAAVAPVGVTEFWTEELVVGGEGGEGGSG